MLNFRRLRQDFSSNILKEGRGLYDKKMVSTAKILHLDKDVIRLSGRVRGNYDNNYESEIEIDRTESSAMDSNCDCPYTYDCQHLAALLFFLEEHIDEILVSYSKEADLDENEHVDEDEKDRLRETFEQAESKEKSRINEKSQKELLIEYIGASEILGKAPYFLPKEESQQVDKAELAIIFNTLESTPGEFCNKNPEIQLALRLPFRSKPLNIPNIKAFINAIRYQEPIYISGKRYLFMTHSFPLESISILRVLMNQLSYRSQGHERNQRIVQVEAEVFGDMLNKVYQLATEQTSSHKSTKDPEGLLMPCLYNASIETPLRFSNMQAGLQFKLEYLESPAPKLFLEPFILIDNTPIQPEESFLFECAKPGLIYKNCYYVFPGHLRRVHLRYLSKIRDMVIPEPLFGTFVENALTELQRFATVGNQEVIERFITLPFVSKLTARCDISYVDAEMEASLFFLYDEIKVPAAGNILGYDDVSLFITDQGILARNLVQEQEIIKDLFQGFVFNKEQGVFIAKTDKVIVEFMTEMLPRNHDRVQFECPHNLLDQFIYDETDFELNFRETDRVDAYKVELKVNGHLKDIKLDLLWECCSSRKTYIELEALRTKRKKGGSGPSKQHKILVLDLDRITPVIQIFDEIGLAKVEDHKEFRPLWSLASVAVAQFDDLPIKVTMSDNLKKIQEQMMGLRSIKSTPIPKEIKAELRNYQKEGIEWLERLRSMHLNGILADDMGLGKTLQAIVAITQNKINNPEAISLVVCPTSLLYNWQEEISRFNPKLTILVIDGIPAQRKKLLVKIDKYDVIITSYSLLQKDVETYKKRIFDYVILDEAQHIKNRGTRNAQSVKLLQSVFKLILTGTPVENSLAELWSLFDFLMPGLLSTYERFVEKYVRDSGHTHKGNMEKLKKKVSPFILRRMKADVLDDLPPVSEIVYHTQLSEVQQDLYKSYADSAREELSNLVKKEGFEKVQIHVLATLTRLKQICCHPAIFAKEKAEKADSAKYEMLLELLDTLIEGQHKVVIFSQYTRMLGIMRKDLGQQGIRFSYLDGSSKNRLEIVKQFNADPSISVFLVSLKAGGSGLNLVGADTVIHYDMWWNPAVESQATDRVHRIGQTKSVMSYKLITLGTIEEKILQMQERKKGLVKKIISSDDEAISKLTWEEVLELLQT